MVLFHGHFPLMWSKWVIRADFRGVICYFKWHNTGGTAAHVCTWQCETYYNADTTNNMACSTSLLESKGLIFIQGQSPIYDCLDWTGHFPSWTWFLLSIYFPKDGGRDEVLSAGSPVSVQSAHFAWWMMSRAAKYSLLTAPVTIYFAHCSLVLHLLWKTAVSKRCEAGSLAKRNRIV